MSKIGVATQTSSPEALVDADLDTLVTALYVKIDDGLVQRPPAGSPGQAEPAGTGVPGRGAGAAGLPQRAQVDPLRHLPPARVVSRTCRISRATTSGCGPRCH